MSRPSKTAFELPRPFCLAKFENFLFAASSRSASARPRRASNFAPGAPMGCGASQPDVATEARGPPPGPKRQVSLKEPNNGNGAANGNNAASPRGGF